MADSSSLPQPPLLDSIILNYGKALVHAGIPIDNERAMIIALVKHALGAPETPPPHAKAAHDVMIHVTLSRYVDLVVGRGVTSREERQAKLDAIHAAIDAFAARAPSSPPPHFEDLESVRASGLESHLGEAVDVRLARADLVAIMRAALGAPETPPPVVTHEEPLRIKILRLECALTETWTWNAAAQLLENAAANESDRSHALAAALMRLHAKDFRARAESARQAPSSPPPPATPSEEAIEAACRATGAQIIDPDDPLALEVVRDMPKVLRAAYAVDFGAQSRPEAKHQEGR